MPRGPRIDFAGALNHVIVRGIERRSIFKENKDKSELLRRIQEDLPLCGMQCFAWCIMKNHFHLLVQTGQIPLAEFMQRVLTGFAVYYNKKYKRIGHLFHNRYKSILCDKESYLLLLIRYIHLNPVKAKVINLNKLKTYRWTGHSEVLIGIDDSLISREDVLQYFGDTMDKALQGYESYVRGGVGLREDFEGGGLVRSAGGIKALRTRKNDDREAYDERILGNGSFVQDVLDTIDGEDRIRKSAGSIDYLLRKIGDYYKIPPDVIVNTRQWRAREARDVFVYMGKQHMGESLTDMGKRVGILQGSASAAFQRGRLLDEETSIANKILL